MSGGQGGDLGQVVGEDPVSGKGFRSFEGVHSAYYPSVSPFGIRVPHPTTLMKLTSRCGEAAVAGLNEALLAQAVGGIAKTARSQPSCAFVVPRPGRRARPRG